MMKVIPPLSASFVTSSTELSQCPKPVLPEYAFIGRSNVGKSSLINMVTGLKMLAKTSSSPGKTRLINHFVIDDKWYLVDLPGYGYAKIGRKARNLFEQMIAGYLTGRPNLMSTFILLDSRLELQENDRRTIGWFGENSLPFVLILTKTDKLTPGQVKNNLQVLTNQLLEEWEELPPVILSSASNRRGREEILDFILKTNQLFDLG